LEVVRIPMPAVGDEMFRSYTNLLIVNGVIVVPTYPTVAPETDLRVLDFFSELMPDHEVFGLDCSNVVRKGGSLHCMTMNVAKM
jgi:agmatine/peptidylarginine deiminase